MAKSDSTARKEITGSSMRVILEGGKLKMGRERVPEGRDTEERTLDERLKETEVGQFRPRVMHGPYMYLG